MRNRFETLHIVLNFLGSLFLVLAMVMLLPIVVVLIYGETRRTLLAFLIPSVLACIVAVSFKLLFRRDAQPGTHHASLICCLGWLGCSAIGALPFVIAQPAQAADK